mmetsp:Transcript_21683/g.24945  ORF Transcript_21683/g.24945 Transcript_21683/m.24945 type:complete len:112 (-) Transcript_21683:25-360(-)
MKDYPKNFKKKLRIFENYFSGKLIEYQSENIFSQFVGGNPFDQSELIVQSKVVSPDKIPSRKKKVPHETRTKRNPFSRKANDFEEDKEENLDEEIDIGVTVHSSIEAVSTK